MTTMMINRIRQFQRSFYVALLAVLATVPGVYPKEGNWIYRQDLAATVPLHNGYTLHSRSAVLLDDNMSELNSVFTGLNLGYRLFSHWRAELGYRHVWIDTRGENRAERRSQAALAWSNISKEWKIGNRSRLELRDYNWERKDDLRFRNRTDVMVPLIQMLGNFRPYVEEEFFIGKNSRKFEQNWLTAGLSVKAKDEMFIKAGYRWIAIRGADQWENRNMLVANLSLNF